MENTLYPHEIILKYKKLISLIIFNICIITLIIYMLAIIIPAINGTINETNITIVQSTQSVGNFCYSSLTPLIIIIFVFMAAIYLIWFD